MPSMCYRLSLLQFHDLVLFPPLSPPDAHAYGNGSRAHGRAPAGRRREPPVRKLVHSPLRVAKRHIEIELGQMRRKYLDDRVQTCGIRRLNSHPNGQSFIIHARYSPIGLTGLHFYRHTASEPHLVKSLPHPVKCQPHPVKCQSQPHARMHAYPVRRFRSLSRTGGRHSRPG